MSTSVSNALSDKDVNITLWTTPDRIANFDWALHSAAAILPSYEALFDYPYVLPKLDILALPDYLFEAMENWVHALPLYPVPSVVHVQEILLLARDARAIHFSTCDSTAVQGLLVYRQTRIEVDPDESPHSTRCTDH